jgi:hypothetical protein
LTRRHHGWAEVPVPVQLLTDSDPDLTAALEQQVTQSMHAENDVLLDDRRGRPERPPGHRRRRHRDHPAQDRGWRSQDIGGATLAAAAMRSVMIDEYVLVTHPVLVGGGMPFFTALDNRVNLELVQTRTLPDGALLTRCETRR